MSGISRGSSASEEPKLFSLLEKRRWRKVRRALKSSAGLQLTRETDSTGLSCLGIALGFQAPVEIIKLLLTVNPDLAHTTDSYGATCLHIACLNGSSLDSIDYLIETHPELVDIADNDKRIPLHHAVEFACQCNYSEDEEFYFELIEAVFKTKPETIFYTDKDDDSPLDLLQMFKTTCDRSDHDRLDDIYQVLRRHSVTEYMKKKKMWEEAGFDTTLKSVDECSKRTGSTDSMTDIKSQGTKASRVSTVGALCNDAGDFEHQIEDHPVYHNNSNINC